MSKPTVVIGADHGGFNLKEHAKEWLSEWGFQVEDVGAYTENPVDDYPFYAFKVAEKVVELEDSRPTVGILFCRSGGGMVVAANKVVGIRAVALESVEAAEHAKAHNNANVASLAADWLSKEQAKTIMKKFIETSFSQEPRHERRLAQISRYEEEKNNKQV